jgi:hypothetical protein
MSQKTPTKWPISAAVVLGEGEEAKELKERGKDQQK